MITLLRKIRRNLLKENKIKSYTLYALGEIFLVVIGILIALQINNWNENQKNRIQELNFIVEINQESKQNKIALKKTVKAHQRVLEKCESLIKLFPISIKNTSLDTLSNLVNGSWLYWSFNPKQNAITSLVELPSFQSMQNKKLKAALSSWEIVLKEFQETEDNAGNFVVQLYDPFFNDNFHYDFDLTDKRTNLKILQTFKFENLIKERAWKQNEILTGRSGKLKRLISIIDEIIELTDREIEKNNIK